jgi:hypothetical protein
MKRQAVKAGTKARAGYPDIHDPRLRALLKKLALGTATLGLAGAMGLGATGCSSSGEKYVPPDVAEDQWSSEDQYWESEGLTERGEVSLDTVDQANLPDIEDLLAPDLDAVADEDWFIGGIEMLETWEE